MQKGYRNALLGPQQIAEQTKLCDQCEDDLKADANPADICNIRFFGPMNVRLGNGYFVASLPTVVILGMGKPEEQFARSMAAIIRHQLDNDKRWDGLRLCAMQNETANDQAVAAALDRAAHDPYDIVRDLATSKQHELREPPTRSVH